MKTMEYSILLLTTLCVVQDWQKSKRQYFKFVGGIPTSVDTVSSACPCCPYWKPLQLNISIDTLLMTMQEVVQKPDHIDQAQDCKAVGAEAFKHQQHLPQWIAYDGKVLRYLAYFREETGSPEESFRLRRCVLNFYLEDNSFSILEPKEDNSGLPQGTFLKRHL